MTEELIKEAEEYMQSMFSRSAGIMGYKWIDNLIKELTGALKKQQVLDSEELVKEVAKEIWETAQADYEYTVDPTQEECRLLAQAAIKSIKEKLGV